MCEAQHHSTCNNLAHGKLCFQPTLQHCWNTIDDQAAAPLQRRLEATYVYASTTAPHAPPSALQPRLLDSRATSSNSATALLDPRARKNGNGDAARSGSPTLLRFYPRRQSWPTPDHEVAPPPPSPNSTAVKHNSPSHLDDGTLPPQPDSRLHLLSATAPLPRPHNANAPPRADQRSPPPTLDLSRMRCRALPVIICAAPASNSTPAPSSSTLEEGEE